jgi:hypothetical protein
MRKWLYLLLAISVLYAVSRFRAVAPRARRPERPPIVKRINTAINVLVWVLLAAYLTAFGYWLFTQLRP